MNLLLTFSSNMTLKEWNIGGIIEREILLYKKISQKGIDVTFLTYGDKEDFLYSDKLEEIKINPINLKKSKKRSFLNILLFPLFKHRKFKAFDIIKTNQMDGSWITWILRLIFKKKILLRCGFEELKIRFHQYNYISRNKKLLIHLIFLYVIEWISYKLANHIIITNNYEKNLIIKYFKIKPKKISVVPNFIETDLFKPISVEKKEKTILFIGSFNEYKNLDNLIESIKYLKDYYLEILGRGKLKTHLQEKIKNLNLESKIKFLRTVPNSKLPEIINQYKLFILPSITEGNPKTLLEAMSCEIACIGTNIPGINQIIKHKENGYLCEQDSLSIAKAIKEVYNDEVLREKIGKNARKYIIRNCSLDKIVKKELNIYKSIMK